ncbi:RNA polymerase sigma-70 factor (ECF subfamily) [Chitinophaga niastensis]|uniref:RNA polymerase sigma-70 factor (ECF subfamily) n=1 Tax=Chitinophaga niastensis TaxID=536980 RepID=A0A2P8HNL5_CHINA|nr:RNA polymerase sigma-70 factor [Chitinophaga niastensis]PSL47820.1 RNA polymerase sigma-70 factor (ECF subfamily) [Chitinophaga niastensis]
MIGTWQQHIALNNDSNAFEALYLHLMPGLSRFAISFVKDAAAAEDIVADIFAALWGNRNELLKIVNLKVYLFTSVRNACMNYLQKRDRITFYAFEDMEVVLEPLVTQANPEQQLIAGEMGRAMQLAIEKLPAKCKLIFKLAKEEKLKYKEIAVILNISVRTIDSQVAIALQRIHEAVVMHLVK